MSKQISFKPGQQVKVAGLDLKCRKTVEIARFVEYLPASTVHTNRDGSTTINDCVILCSDGIQVICDSRSLMA